MLAASFPHTFMPAEYVTQNLHLAAFLYHRGAVLTGCVRVRPKRYRFHFAADWELHESLRVYWSGDLTPVVPASLLDTPAAVEMLGRRAEEPHPPPNP